MITTLICTYLIGVLVTERSLAIQTQIDPNMFESDSRNRKFAVLTCLFWFIYLAYSLISTFFEKD